MSCCKLVSARLTQSAFNCQAKVQIGFAEPTAAFEVSEYYRKFRMKQNAFDNTTPALFTEEDTIHRAAIALGRELLYVNKTAESHVMRTSKLRSIADPQK